MGICILEVGERLQEIRKKQCTIRLARFEKVHDFSGSF